MRVESKRGMGEVFQNMGKREVEGLRERQLGREKNNWKDFLYRYTYI